MTAISIALRPFCSNGVHHPLLWLSSTLADSEYRKAILVTGQMHDGTKNKCLYIFTADKVHGNNFNYTYFREVI